MCKSRQREEQETEGTRVGCGGEDTGDQRSRDEEERDTTEHELHRTGRGWESLLQGRSSMDETRVQDRHAKCTRNRICHGLTYPQATLNADGAEDEGKRRQ